MAKQREGDGLQWLSELPDWETDGAFATEDQLPTPPEALRPYLKAWGLWPFPVGVVQIVGSKGKGSVAGMLECLATSAQVHIGVYTSPHIHQREERTRVSGEPLAASLWEQAASALQSFSRQAIGPELSRFEAETLMALWCFVHESCDLIVLEAGLGGVWDATSVVPASLVVVTSIELEHTALLGETIEQIAAQKAGVVGEGVPCVVGPLPEQAMRVVRRITRERGAPLREVGSFVAVERAFPLPAGTEITLEWGGRQSRERFSFVLPVLGPHQPYMAALTWAAWLLWSDITNRPVYPRDLSALESLVIPGRLQLVELGPKGRWLLDMAHTPRSVKAALSACQLHFQAPPRVVVMALLRDKAIEECLELVWGSGAHLVFVGLQDSRAASPFALRDALPAVDGREVYAFSGLFDSLETLQTLLSSGDVCLFLGSSRLLRALTSEVGDLFSRQKERDTTL